MFSSSFPRRRISSFGSRTGARPTGVRVDTLNRNGRKGRNKLKLSADSLGTGRFRMKVTAYDALNRRASAEAPFSLAAGPRP